VQAKKKDNKLRCKNASAMGESSDITREGAFQMFRKWFDGSF
jgi:hypothetical protein